MVEKFSGAPGGVELLASCGQESRPLQGQYRFPVSSRLRRSETWENLFESCLASEAVHLLGAPSLRSLVRRAGLEPA